MLTRRSLLGRAGLALGGAMTLGAVNACSSGSDPAPVAAKPRPADFPYAQHLDASYQLDASTVQQSAYEQYYAGGCCHGAYYGLMKHLADTAGAPFDQLPLDFGKFGGGGIASFGSICGSLLGSILVVNSIVPDVTKPVAAPATDAPKYTIRTRMITELMRWYEANAFPAYVPGALAASETTAAPTLDFGAGNIANLQVVPGSHLCHASVTKWCAAMGKPSNGPDKKARCARLTADVAGKATAMLNTFLSTGEFPTTGMTVNAAADCTCCHTQAPAASTPPIAPVAAGMECSSCHPVNGATNDWVHPLPSTHSANPTGCNGCH